jgi:hypothetical protein
MQWQSRCQINVAALASNDCIPIAPRPQFLPGLKHLGYLAGFLGVVPAEG